MPAICVRARHLRRFEAGAWEPVRANFQQFAPLKREGGRSDPGDLSQEGSLGGGGVALQRGACRTHCRGKTLEIDPVEDLYERLRRPLQHERTLKPSGTPRSALRQPNNLGVSDEHLTWTPAREAHQIADRRSLIWAAVDPAAPPERLDGGLPDVAQPVKGPTHVGVPRSVSCRDEHVDPK